MFLLNRTYNGWQKVKEVRVSVAEAERNFAYFEHQRTRVESGELSVGEGSREQFETSAANAAEQAVIERRRLPCTLDEWLRVLVLDVEPPGRQ